ncbi:unnamed protein product [Somion occarium]|uniref:Uncharacterized protein n=1 Tax=Somion occarium TaxID=3059160 RepID=A0ABP1CQ98_9APHY
MSNASWAPLNETTSQIWIEEATIDGVTIEAVGYGAHLTLFFQCFELLWSVRRKQPKFAYTFLVYISALSICSAIGAASFRINQQAFVNNRNFPGGPAQYGLLSFNSLNVLGPGGYMAASWLQDGLLLYRFYVIWGGSLLAMILPTLLFLSSIIMSCLLLSELEQPGSTMWAPSNTVFAVGFGSTTVATTLLLSTLIVSRLLYTRYKLSKIMGSVELAPYLTVSAMIAESALLYVVCALTFMITYATGSTVSYLIYGFLGQAPSIAPLIIIRRVAEGRAASKAALAETTMVTTGIQFGAPEMSAVSPTTVDLQTNQNRDPAMKTSQTTDLSPLA